MTINNQSDFPEVEALGLTQEVSSSTEADKDGATGEWSFKNRRDPNTYEEFPLDVFPPKTRIYIEEKAASCEADSAPLAMALLAQAGAHVGQSHLLRLKSDHLVGATLWVAIAAISGYGKSPLLRSGIRLISGVEHRWYKDYRKEKVEYDKACKAYKKSNQIHLLSHLHPR